MKKVCIIFLILTILISNGYIDIKEVLIFCGCFLICHSFIFFADCYKYYKKKGEYDYLILSLQKCIERRDIQ